MSPCSSLLKENICIHAFWNQTHLPSFSTFIFYPSIFFTEHVFVLLRMFIHRWDRFMETNWFSSEIMDMVTLASFRLTLLWKLYPQSCKSEDRSSSLNGCSPCLVGEGALIFLPIGDWRHCAQHSCILLQRNPHLANFSHSPSHSPLLVQAGGGWRPTAQDAGEGSRGHLLFRS